jgi:probable rRNA maturation factor
MINFEINNLTAERIEKGFLKRVAQRAIKIIRLKNLKEVSLAIVGNAKIKELNKKYRRKNEVTDVLSFNYGEIFICLPQAKKQAKQLGHSLKKELAILLIHGLLHLAGYDDETMAGYDIMMKKQNEILLKLNLYGEK